MLCQFIGNLFPQTIPKKPKIIFHNDFSLKISPLNKISKKQIKYQFKVPISEQQKPINNPHSPMTDETHQNLDILPSTCISNTIQNTPVSTLNNQSQCINHCQQQNYYLFIQNQSIWENQQEKQIYKIRLKEIQFLKQLCKIKQQQKQMLMRKTTKKYQQTPQPPHKQPQQLTKKTRNKTISPLSISQISNNQLQLKITQIANNIRCKIKKNNNNRRQKSQIKFKIKDHFTQNKSSVHLPKIINNNSKTHFLQLPHFHQQQSLTTLKKNNSIDSSLVIPKIMNFILKKLMKKIQQSEKYRIHYDPVHHIYPMTYFRKRILQQRKQQHKLRDLSQLQKKIKLNQRIQMLVNSRIKRNYN